jgi:nanoRNase/pAp phosphatase (c-di-AMP/oligoRNAs hydrolase)
MEKGRDLGSKLRKISSKLDTDFIPVMTLERDVDMAFKDFIDREMPEDKEDLKKLKEEISGSFRPMVTMVGKLIMFYGNLSNQGRAAASFMFNYIVLSSDALKIKVEDIPGEKKE